MSKGTTIVVHVVAVLFLVFAVLSLLGDDRADDVVDKASLYLSFFIIHFPLLVWTRKHGAVSIPTRVKVAWIIVGVVAGLVVGYLVWNVLLYVTMEVIRGSDATNVLIPMRRPRFDMRASWGVLCLAASLAALIASKPYFSVRMNPEENGTT